MPGRVYKRIRRMRNLTRQCRRIASPVCASILAIALLLLPVPAAAWEVGGPPLFINGLTCAKEGKLGMGLARFPIHIGEFKPYRGISDIIWKCDIGYNDANNAQPIFTNIKGTLLLDEPGLPKANLDITFGAPWEAHDGRDGILEIGEKQDEERIAKCLAEGTGVSMEDGVFTRIPSRAGVRCHEDKSDPEAQEILSSYVVDANPKSNPQNPRTLWQCGFYHMKVPKGSYECAALIRVSGRIRAEYIFDATVFPRDRWIDLHHAMVNSVIPRIAGEK